MGRVKPFPNPNFWDLVMLGGVLGFGSHEHRGVLRAHVSSLLGGR